MADEFLRRIDEHMARGNEHMARGNEHMARGNELMAEVREEMRLTREFFASMMADQREFMREIVLRVERIGADQIRELRDLRDESRAQRDALLRLIDRLGPPGSEPAT